MKSFGRHGKNEVFRKAWDEYTLSGGREKDLDLPRLARDQCVQGQLLALGVMPSLLGTNI